MRFTALDALRGIAALLVALFHSAFYMDTPSPFVRHAYVFVDFFFALSGFVVAHAYLERVGRGEVGFLQFLVLRIGRVYPLHLFMLLLWLPFVLAKYAAFSAGIGGRDPLAINTLEQFLLQALLLNSAFGADEAVWNYPSWSISAEIACYLAFFAWAALAAARSAWAMLVLALGAYALLGWLYGEGFLRMYDAGFLRGIAGFFVGVAIYRAWQGRPWPGMPPALRTGLEIAALALVFFAVSNAGLGGIAQPLALASLFLALLVFASEEGGAVSRLLQRAPFQRLGDWSYSIYMVHALFMQASHNVAVYVFHLPESSLAKFEGTRRIVVLDAAPLLNLLLLIAVVAVSALTWRYIEVPWRERFRVYARRFAKPGGS